MFGAACKRPHNGATGGVSQVTEIKQPGDLVSADQMEAGTPGYMPFTSGRPSKHRYNTCTVWIDHHSKYIYGHLQESKDGKSTLEGKVQFKSFAKQHGVSIKHIRADNGVFHSKAFQEHLAVQNQGHSLCGVGAHWQNGVVE
jgi:hypothetical protein